MRFTPEMMVSDLFDFERDDTLAIQLFEGGKIYPWEIIPNINGFLLELIKSKNIKANFTEYAENVWVGKNSEIDKRTVTIIGPCIIGDNCKIKHGAFIRENVIIGNGVTIGNSTEIKNSILFDCVTVPHLNYIGDSIIGYKAHLGAGAIISNVKLDETKVSVNINGISVNTGLKKFGALVGDFAQIGCNSVINPGTVIGKYSHISPLTSARGVIPSRSILKSDGTIVRRLLTY